MAEFYIYDESSLLVGSIRKSYPVKFIDPKKRYTVDYLAPHQSKSGEKEEGIFTLDGADLTENQIWELFLKEAL